MKQFLHILLALALLCGLCACGGQPETPREPAEPPRQADAQTPAEPVPQTDGGEKTSGTPDSGTPQEPDAPDSDTPDTDMPDAEENAAPGGGDGTSEPPAAITSHPEDTRPAEPPAPQEPAAPEPVDYRSVAEGLVGRPVSELYAAIGRPLSADYAPSCLIDGDDGELTYDGFIVYTERGADYETVYAVF